MQFRKISMPPASVIRKVAAESRSLPELGHSVHRHLALMDIWAIASKLGGMIPTQLQWPAEILIRDELANYNTQYIDAFTEFRSDPDMTNGLATMLARHWIELKSVEVSDTPNWYTLDNHHINMLLDFTENYDVAKEDMVFPYDGFGLEIPTSAITDFSGYGDRTSISIARGSLNVEKYSALSKEKLETYESLGFANVDGGDHIVYGSGLYHRENRWDTDITVNVIPIPDGHVCSRYLRKEKKSVEQLVIGFLALNRILDFDRMTTATKRRGSRGVPTNKSIDVGKLLNSGIWVVGSKISVTNNRYRIECSRTPSVDAIGCKPTVVSGHLRRYRCGPRNAWHYEVREIRPFRRGGIGPALGHSYKVTK